MSDDASADMQKLGELRASGAITQEQFERLARSVLQAPSEGRPTGAAPNGLPGSRPSSPSLLGVAGAAGAGALVGALAADMLQSALADPPPEVLEAHIVESTTFTEDGYVTHGEITFEDANGEVVGETTYVEEAAWQDPGDPQWSDQGSDVADAGWDSGGADFGVF